MIKLVYCITRRPDLAHEQFLRYWREVHAPIARGIPGLRRLVQSAAIDVEGDARSGDFDGMAELWFDDVLALLRARNSPEWAEAAEDEKNFIDHSRVAYFVTTETDVPLRTSGIKLVR